LLISWLSFAGAVDDLAGDAAFGEASGVGAVEVVVGEVVLEVFGERGQLRYERAGRTWLRSSFSDVVPSSGALDAAARRFTAGGYGLQRFYACPRVRTWTSSDSREAQPPASRAPSRLLVRGVGCP
jgi:hypothetical protein